MYIRKLYAGLGVLASGGVRWHALIWQCQTTVAGLSDLKYDVNP
jgi:hypothetical protein